MNRRFREPPFDHLEPQTIEKLADGWPESEKDVFQAALSMVVVKIVGERLVNFLWAMEG